MSYDNAKIEVAVSGDPGSQERIERFRIWQEEHGIFRPDNRKPESAFDDNDNNIDDSCDVVRLFSCSIERRQQIRQAFQRLAESAHRQSQEYLDD